MSIALVQTKGQPSSNYTSTNAVTFTSNVTVGNLIVLNITAGNADTISSVVDNHSNTYTLAVNSANPTSGERQSWLYYAKNVASGSTTITVTFGTTPDSALIAREYSGLDISSPFDKSSTNNDGTSYNNTHDAGTTATTTLANELVILGGCVSASSDPVLAAGTGYGNGIEQKGYDLYTYAFMSDKIVSSTGAQSGNFVSTSYVRGAAFIATFKAATVSATVMTPVFSKLYNH